MSGRVDVERGTVHGWEGVWIRRPPLELGLVPDVGGRLTSLRWRGRELSFVHPGEAGLVLPVRDAADVRAFKRATGFVHFGGDKTWLAPQERWTDGIPFFDLHAGAYDAVVDAQGSAEVRVAMRSPVDRETGARIVRTVTVRGGADDFVVEHVLENAAAHPIAWGLWDVHELAGPGIAYVARRAGSPFPGGLKAFPAEGDSEGARTTALRAMDDVVAIDCRRKHWFKFGTDAEGWALAVVETPDGLVGYAKAVPVVPDGTYGHGCVVEVYNDPHHLYFEVEAHAPVVRLAPGERATMVERRAVLDLDGWPATGAAVRAIVDAALRAAPAPAHR